MAEISETGETKSIIICKLKKIIPTTNSKKKEDREENITRGEEKKNTHTILIGQYAWKRLLWSRCE
jgi:hypothetical protein